MNMTIIPHKKQYWFSLWCTSCSISTEYTIIDLENNIEMKCNRCQATLLLINDKDDCKYNDEICQHPKLIEKDIQCNGPCAV
jgi:hypothetical protein